jgi:DNA/RNA-binding domain of Phe-tRNA-synthetase-like protein
MKILIAPEIKQKTPNFYIGIMTCNVTVYDNPTVTKLIQSIEASIRENIDISEVVDLPIIKDGRNAYKIYGKDPSRYRLATESLYRRLAKGNKLYRINNVVDLGNVLSIQTRKSIAVLDYNKISGDVLIRLGRKNDIYFGIGRGKINVENIPLYEDQIGPFGSVTSDTERTMITKSTTKILLFVISFSGKDQLIEELQLAEDLYKNYAKGTNFTKNII